MDCCKSSKEGSEESCCNDFKKLKGGKIKMNTKTVLWIVIAVLAVATLFLTFKAGAGGGIETVQAASSAAKSAASSSVMVGGC